MFKRNTNAVVLLVRGMDIANIVMGFLSMALAVFVLVKPDSHIFMVANVLLLAAVMNIFMSVKQYLKDEYQAFLIRAIIGGVLLVIGIILKIAFYN